MKAAWRKQEICPDSAPPPSYPVSYCTSVISSGTQDSGRLPGSHHVGAWPLSPSATLSMNVNGTLTSIWIKTLFLGTCRSVRLRVGVATGKGLTMEERWGISVSCWRPRALTSCPLGNPSQSVLTGDFCSFLKTAGGAVPAWEPAHPFLQTQMAGQSSPPPARGASRWNPPRPAVALVLPLVDFVSSLNPADLGSNPY